MAWRGVVFFSCKQVITVNSVTSCEQFRGLEKPSLVLRRKWTGFSAVPSVSIAAHGSNLNGLCRAGQRHSNHQGEFLSALQLLATVEIRRRCGLKSPPFFRYDLLNELQGRGFHRKTLSSKTPVLRYVGAFPIDCIASSDLCSDVW
jgi:hypothetical protein